MEVTEKSRGAVGVPKPLERPMEYFLGTLEIRVAGCDVTEVEALEFREKIQYASRWVLKLSMLSNPGSMKLNVTTGERDAAGL